MKDYDQPVSIDGSVLEPGAVYTESFTQYEWQGNGHGFLIFVPDETAESCTAIHSAYAAMTKEPVSESQFQALTDIQETGRILILFWQNPRWKTIMPPPQPSSYSPFIIWH